MKTKFAIGCLVQWYEAEIIEEYVISLLDAIKSYDGEVIVDFHVTTNEELEKPVSAEKMKYCERKIKSAIAILGEDIKIKISCKLRENQQ